MRTGLLSGRQVLVRGAATDQRAVDVETASGGLFGPDPLDALDDWDEFRSWADGCGEAGTPFSIADLGPPVPGPRQVFAIGLNYRDHAAEASMEAPANPPTFTKLVSCLAGPIGDLTLPAGSVDWEVELVAVIGRESRHVPVERAWDHVAGLAVGQDYSERRLQTSGPAPQFSLGKSHPGFGPLLVTPDDVPDPDDLALACLVNGDTVQQDRTSAMIFPVSELIARLSSVVTLWPGDLVFTGTPSGVGMARTPPWFLEKGDEVVSVIEGLGELRQRCV
jgi:2-keto-4-pentenoate hydratase/2-oxohepta-3-ene-1,7-dioic acid hydratase in catechol pathway